MEFFPVHYEQMEENNEFKKLSPVYKAYYYLLQSQFNRKGMFYASDGFFAATLDCSIESIRKARRLFKKLGWITIGEGKLDKGGRGLATTYYYVKWAATKESNRFAQISRSTFTTLLKNGINIARIKCPMIVTYISLCYWRQFNSYDNDDFFITKTKLRELTGFNNVIDPIKCTQQTIEFTDGSHLFNYKDEHFKLKITKWVNVAEPSKDENTRKQQYEYWDMVKQRGKHLQRKLDYKEEARNKKKGEWIAEQFKEKYIEKYNTKPQFYSQQYEELGCLYKKMGKDKLLLEINAFFENETFDSRKTLGQFIRSMKK